MNKTAQTSITTIKDAIDLLKAKDIKPTQLNVSKEANLSIRTIKRHWDRVTEESPSSKERVTLPKPDRVTLDKERVTDNKPAVENRVTGTKVTKPNRVTGSSFERFRRRVERSPIQVYQCSPDMF